MNFEVHLVELCHRVVETFLVVDIFAIKNEGQFTPPILYFVFLFFQLRRVIFWLIYDRKGDNCVPKINLSTEPR